MGRGPERTEDGLDFPVRIQSVELALRKFAFDNLENDGPIFLCRRETNQVGFEFSPPQSRSLIFEVFVLSRERRCIHQRGGDEDFSPVRENGRDDFLPYESRQGAPRFVSEEVRLESGLHARFGE